MNTILIRDPDTGEVVQALDPNGPTCWGANCGDCVGCMEKQALYWGFMVEYVEE